MHEQRFAAYVIHSGKSYSQYCSMLNNICMGNKTYCLVLPQTQNSLLACVDSETF